MSESVNSFESEIKELEAKLEAKKREMIASGNNSPEKHIFKAVIKEHSGHEAVPLPVASVTPAITPTAPQTLSTEDQKKVDELVMHAFTKGIKSAVREARNTNLPYLIDALHDQLVDEYYQKLIEARKLNTD